MHGFRRSLSIIFLSSNAVTVVNFIVSLVLARLLSPADIGIFSMTAVFINIAHTFRDFGVSTYLMREKDLTPEKIRSASGLLICASWSIAIALFFAAQPVASFYGQPGVRDVVRVLAIGFFLIPFGSVTHSIMRRNLAANQQAIVMAIGTTAYAASCIGFAALGMGYMSLAWANLVNIIATIIGYMPFRPKDAPWLPSFRGWRGIAHFGSGAVLGSLVNNANNAVSDILLGRLLNAHAVGIYSRTNSLVELFTYVTMPAVNNMAVPYISHNFHNRVPLSPIMCKAAAYLSGLAWPVLLVTAFFADDIIRVLFGHQWLECVPLVWILCIGSAARTPLALTTPALLAIGRPYLSVMTVGASLLLKLCIALAISANSLRSFALAFMAAELLSMPLFIAIWCSQFAVTIRDVVRAFLPGFNVTIIFVPVVFLLLQLPSTWLPVVRLGFVAVVCSLVWVSAIIFCKHPLSEEIGLAWGRLRERMAS